MCESLETLMAKYYLQYFFIWNPYNRAAGCHAVTF